jgi:uncharacterized protein YoxC
MTGTIVFVIICNLLITAVALYVARTVWQLRRTLASVTQTINEVECNVYNVLHPAPEAITKGKNGIHNLTELYQSKQIQIQKIRQVLSLIAVIYRLSNQNKSKPWYKLRKKVKKKQRY